MNPTPTSAPVPIAQGTSNYWDIWNKAWNEGYTHSTAPLGSFQSSISSNPGGVPGYSEGYSAGQQAYIADKNKVLGANTITNPTPKPASNPTAPINITFPTTDTSGASDEAARREAQARGEIESGYGSYLSGLGGLQTSYENARTDELSSAAKTYEQIFGGLTEQKQTNLDKLQANAENVKSRQASSIQDLQTNLSNVLRASSMQYGAMGAGDTSATRTMLPYAYTKLAGAQEGSIRNQSNQQLFDIDQQKSDTELEFSKMWRQTEIDKESSLTKIKQYYGDAIRNVQTAMAQAPLDKGKDLASLSQSLLQEAQSNLRQLESENRQRQENIKTWATNRMSELNNLKLELSGSASFSPKDIVWNELQMQGATPTTMNYNDYATAVRKKYLGE